VAVKAAQRTSLEEDDCSEAGAVEGAERLDCVDTSDHSGLLSGKRSAGLGVEIIYKLEFVVKRAGDDFALLLETEAVEANCVARNADCEVGIELRVLDCVFELLSVENINI